MRSVSGRKILSELNDLDLYQSKILIVDVNSAVLYGQDAKDTLSTSQPNGTFNILNDTITRFGAGDGLSVILKEDTKRNVLVLSAYALDQEVPYKHELFERILIFDKVVKTNKSSRFTFTVLDWRNDEEAHRYSREWRPILSLDLHQNLTSAANVGSNWTRISMREGMSSEVLATRMQPYFAEWLTREVRLFIFFSE